MTGVSSLVFTEVIDLFIERHGDRMISPEQYNDLVVLLGELEVMWLSLPETKQYAREPELPHDLPYPQRGSDNRSSES
jgi:hypothetical protein